MVGYGIQIFLGLVGLFTLLVAGVGVANIMYVVVRERTREIGVKLAVGARKRHIRSQFVFEALAICLTGGIAGLLLAWSSWSSWPAFFEIPPCSTSPTQLSWPINIARVDSGRHRPVGGIPAGPAGGSDRSRGVTPLRMKRGSPRGRSARGLP